MNMMPAALPPRARLGTWYPPGESVTITALNLAAKHGSPKKAIAALDRSLAKWKRHPVEIDPKILHGLQRTRLILEFWSASDSARK